MRAASRSGVLTVIVGLGLLAGCGGGALRSAAPDAARETAPAPAPTSVEPSPGSLPPAAADATPTAADPAVAFAGLEAARRSLYAAPDPGRVGEIWAPGTEAFAVAVLELTTFAAAAQHVEETGFELVAVEVVDHAPERAALRVVVGPGSGRVVGSAQTWEAAAPVTYDVVLVPSAAGGWRLAHEVQVGSPGGAS